MGVDGLLLRNSSGRLDPIQEFVVFNISVEGITRSVWAMVQPPGGDDSVLLLLGQPWLWDVVAILNIRDNSLTSHRLRMTGLVWLM